MLRYLKPTWAVMAIILFALPGPVPSADWVVDQAHPQADDTNPGNAALPLRTVSQAATRARAGDTVHIRPGIYRELVSPAYGGTASAPITYKGADRATTILTGSDAVSLTWTRDGSLFKATLPSSLQVAGSTFWRALLVSAGTTPPPVARPSTATTLPLCLGQVFCQGALLRQTTSRTQAEATSGSWYLDGTGSLLRVHLPTGVTDPAACAWELSTRTGIFIPARRGLKHLRLQDLSFIGCGNPGPFPQRGAVSVRSGNSWRIERCTIRFANTIGLDCGSETWIPEHLEDTVDADRRIIIGGNHLIRHCDVSDNGLCGIAGWNHQGTRIEGNRVERNAALDLRVGLQVPWEDWGGIKVHGSNTVIHGNLVRDNRAHGIWLDNGYAQARLTSNLVVGNFGSGIMVEYGYGACLIAENTVVGTTRFNDSYRGFGIYTHDASDAVIVHNLLVNNASEAITMRIVSNRVFQGKTVGCSGMRVLNNVIASGAQPAFAMPPAWDRCVNNQGDGNLFIANPVNAFVFTDALSPTSAYTSARVVKGERLDLAAWRAASGRDANSILVGTGLLWSLDAASLRLNCTLPPAWTTLTPQAVPAMDGIPWTPIPRSGPRWLTADAMSLDLDLPPLLDLLGLRRIRIRNHAGHQWSCEPQPANDWWTDSEHIFSGLETSHEHTMTPVLENSG